MRRMGAVDVIAELDGVGVHRLENVMDDYEIIFTSRI